ncbi:angiopoietin-related protein 7-like [Pecten maximus]|uniref:angiopoietin-related protein 7-like n=1 Tax=Pecten maximus TaxID=6579 RepID=UPI0014581583|nr:angiopoietin-related protein 7-like [Pecten maximus]
MKRIPNTISFPVLVIRNCSDVPKGSPSGIYILTTTEGGRFKIFCDMDAPSGPWAVIQRRTSRDVDFYRNWASYKVGFGDLLGNFWIGNDNLHVLTSTPRILRVELEGWDGTKGYAEYSTFQVANEDQNYRLSVQGFSGNISYDALAYHNGYQFTTYDRDNDIRGENCAELYRGGWWYKRCYDANLNGLYPIDNGNTELESMTWWYFPDTNRAVSPLKKSKMMIR